MQQQKHLTLLNSLAIFCEDRKNPIAMLGSKETVDSAITSISTALLIFSLTDASIQEREYILTNETFLEAISCLEMGEVNIMHTNALRSTWHFGDVDSYKCLLSFIDKHWYNKIHSSKLRDSFFYVNSFNSNAPSDLADWSLLIRSQKNMANILEWTDYLEEKFKQPMPIKGRTSTRYSTLLICDLISDHVPFDRCEFVLKKSQIISEQDKEAVITSIIEHNRLDLLEWVRINQPHLLFPEIDIRLDTPSNRNSSLLKRLSSIMNSQSLSYEAVSFFTNHMVNMPEEKWLVQALNEFKDKEGNLEAFELKNLSILQPAIEKLCLEAETLSVLNKQHQNTVAL